MKTLATLGIITALALTLAVACSDDGGKSVHERVATPLSGQMPAAPAAGGASALTPSAGSLFQPGQDSITVDGYGSLTALVDNAVLSFTLVPDPGFDPIGTPCPPDQPCPPPSSGNPALPPLAQQDLASVLAAVSAQSISDAQITVINRHSGAVSAAEIYVTVSDLGRLDPIVDAVSAATHASDRVALLTGAGISSVMSVEECLALKRQAFDMALADARKRAQSLVEGFEVVVGDMVSAEERAASLPCSLYGAIFDDEIGFRLPVSYYTPGQPAEETFISEITVTFAIR